MRTRPAPSAPAASAARASATDPRLAATVDAACRRGTRPAARRAARSLGPALGQLGGPRRGTRRAAPARGRRAARRSRRRGRSCVPSGTSSTSRPAATTSGMSRARARIAACEVGAALGEDDAVHQVGVQPGGLGRASGPARPGRPRPTVCRAGLAGQRAQHLVADGADVVGALAQVGVGQLRPLRARPRRGSRPRPRPRRRRCRCAP